MVFCSEGLAPTTLLLSIMGTFCTILDVIVIVLPFIAVCSSSRLIGCMQ